MVKTRGANHVHFTHSRTTVVICIDGTPCKPEEVKA